MAGYKTRSRTRVAEPNRYLERVSFGQAMSISVTTCQLNRATDVGYCKHPFNPWTGNDLPNGSRCDASHCVSS